MRTSTADAAGTTVHATTDRSYVLSVTPPRVVDKSDLDSSVSHLQCDEGVLAFIYADIKNASCIRETSTPNSAGKKWSAPYATRLVRAASCAVDTSFARGV